MNITHHMPNQPHTERSGQKYFWLALAFTTLLSACSNWQAGGRQSVIVPSENQDNRVRILVIHHTTADFEDSLNILTKDSGNPVSSHYLIPEPNDPSYSGKKLKLYELVPEQARAWHAGSSYWAGKTALNDMSIGIELVNRTYCHKTDDSHRPPTDKIMENQICFYPDFADSQLEILEKVVAGILQRHPQISATAIVGHSDIAPQRKVDPGPRFPWQRLYTMGYGAWPDDETVIEYWEKFRLQLPSVPVMQQALHDYGYKINRTGIFDEQTANVIRAFQLHFLPWHLTKQFDARTAATLFALLEKYRAEKLEHLIGQ